MRNKLTIIVFVFLFSINIFSQICDCKPAKKDDTTRFGGNVINPIVFDKSYKILQGKITDLIGEPIKSALIEIFDKPDWIKNGKYSPPDNQKRIYACVTSKNGKFRIPKLSKGNYELRVSISVNWNPEYYYVEIDPKKTDSIEDDLEIIMSVGG